MYYKPVLLTLGLICLISFGAHGQTATIKGKVFSNENKPLVAASVGVLGTTLGTQSNSKGEFKLIVPVNININVIISYVGYTSKSVGLYLSAEQVQEITFYLSPDSTALSTVTVTGKDPRNTREEVSLTRLDPRHTKELPTAFNEFNKILSTLPGVISNNELSSTYAVRGGNYDENLVYVNGIEIYRPFLVTNAQQEGLSFINPDLVGNIEFSSGGWQPKYGDKLSSVLNIDYKKPQEFAASVTGGLLGGGLHTEGTSPDKRFTYLVGARYKNAQLLFNRALETSGNYQPKFGDIQTYLNYDLRKNRPGKTQLSLLASMARNKYLVLPSNRETTFGTFNQFIRLAVAYAGREQMEYDAYQGGLKLQHQLTNQLTTEIILTSLLSREREYRNVEAGYRFCDIDTDPNSPSFNQCVSEREVGTSFEYARNNLLARIFSLENRYVWNKTDQDRLQWGFKWSRENFSDQIREYGFIDSADFISTNNQLQTDLKLISNRLSGYVQHTRWFDKNRTITYGLRMQYWDFNKETTLSPRVQYAFPASRNSRLSYKFAVGLYHQPPLYRELRDLQGNLHPEVKAQRAYHAIAGQEYYFKAWNRSFKLVTEAYYKYLTHVIPYEVDNVRLRYFAKNNAKAYAYGFDARLNGEFIKGAESWFSLGILSTKENITGDSTFVFDAANRGVIGRKALKYIRRPTDQRVNLGIFFQDHIPNDPSLKMYLDLIFGTGLPFSPPGNEGLRNQYNMPSYKRVDIGFSKLITLNANQNKKYSLESLWLSLEILNLVSAKNVISYDYVQDVNQVTYSVPNYLSSRLVNLRFIARF